MVGIIGGVSGLWHSMRALRALFLSKVCKIFWRAVEQKQMQAARIRFLRDRRKCDASVVGQMWQSNRTHARWYGRLLRRLCFGLHMERDPVVALASANLRRRMGLKGAQQQCDERHVE